MRFCDAVKQVSGGTMTADDAAEELLEKAKEEEEKFFTLNPKQDATALVQKLRDNPGSRMTLYSLPGSWLRVRIRIQRIRGTKKQTN